VDVMKISDTEFHFIDERGETTVARVK